ncbi:hypothetical protein VSA01S_08630 [Vibrio sagamiensis NBRC 104589]|uniref:Uncharacterized protein n=1 Tax=Vibrio sagamiensis NBRC 104589 TaxID=1219064 RepID=A0A511QBS8_9VIBR|nr:hypothetical protein VSA01S_08630 [Vibrio sagamiensis NBRC 104589]
MINILINSIARSDITSLLTILQWLKSKITLQFEGMATSNMLITITLFSSNIKKHKKYISILAPKAQR